MPERARRAGPVVPVVREARARSNSRTAATAATEHLAWAEAAAPALTAGPVAEAEATACSAVAVAEARAQVEGHFLAGDGGGGGGSDLVPPGVSASVDTTGGPLVQISYKLVPTSRSQCMNGGWRNSPQFKTLGDCISFVETGR